MQIVHARLRPVLSQAHAVLRGVTRNPYKFRGPNTWAMVREAYLAGETAESVALRFDVGASAMKRRMHKEGWTRRDHAAAIDPVAPRRTPGPSAPRLEASPLPAASDAPPEPPVASSRPPPDPTAAELARWSIRQAAQALGEGRMADARGLSQMAESLSRTAAREPKTSLEVILRALRDRDFRVELFRVDPDNPDDPDLPTKLEYWTPRDGSR